MPLAGLLHDSQCYGSRSSGESLELVYHISLEGGTIFCDGEPEVHHIRDDSDFDDMDDGFFVETDIVLSQGATYYLTFIACDYAGNCTVYDADEDSDALMPVSYTHLTLPTIYSV